MGLIWSMFSTVLSLLEDAISHSQYNDIYLATLFIIGIFLIFLNILGFKNSIMSYMEVILILKSNKKKIQRSNTFMVIYVF